jgi:hypothetical protein
MIRAVCPVQTQQGRVMPGLRSSSSVLLRSAHVAWLKAAGRLGAPGAGAQASECAPDLQVFAMVARTRPAHQATNQQEGRAHRQHGQRCHNAHHDGRHGEDDKYQSDQTGQGVGPGRGALVVIHGFSIPMSCLIGYGRQDSAKSQPVSNFVPVKLFTCINTQARERV